MIRKRMPLIGIFGSIVLVVALYAPSATPAWATKAPGAPASAQASVRATHGPGEEAHANTPAAAEEAHDPAAETSHQAHARAQSQEQQHSQGSQQAAEQATASANQQSQVSAMQKTREQASV